MFLKRDDLDNIGYQKGDTEGIVNYGLSLKGVVFCAIFIEDVNSKNSVKISFRSIGDFACNKFAENNPDKWVYKSASYFKEFLSDVFPCKLDK